MGGSILARLDSDASVVLVRLRSLGDTVLATPAFALLRRALPHARIRVAMDDRFAGVLTGQPDIDGVLRVPSQAGAAAKAKVVKTIRSLRPSLCVDMHGGATAAWLTALSGARWKVGFAHFRHKWAYNVRVPRAQEVLGRAADARVHTAEHHAAAIIHLGAEARAIPRAQLAAIPSDTEEPYAVIHAGAAYFTKVWPGDGFRRLALELRRLHGLEPIFMAGPGEEALAEQFSEFQVRKILRLAELKALMSGATLFVGNDSGPAHVAASYGVPCVVIFGSSDSTVWHPWKVDHRVVETAWDCKPCRGDRCYAFDEPRCILSVETASVSGAVSDLLTGANPLN